MSKSVLRQLLHRSPHAHKYDFGHVLVIGGSSETVGAPFLTALGALRTGAGLVTVAGNASVVHALQARVQEVMLLRMPSHAADAVRVLQSFIHERSVNAVVIGPGLGAGTKELVRQFLKAATVPVVIDGAAFRAFEGGHIDILKREAIENPHLIVTPHDGEYERLIGEKPPQTLKERMGAVAPFAITYGVTLVMKGNPTLVITPKGEVYVNKTNTPALATAGTGDVLSGVIAGLIAQGLNLAEAAEIGTRLHGKAGEIASKDKTEPAVIASDVIEALPAAFKKLISIR